MTLEEVIEALENCQRGTCDKCPYYDPDADICDEPVIADALHVLRDLRELKQKKGKCTKTNCSIQMNYISNDCDMETCPYRTEYKNGKWKSIALFTRECSECGAQFHELEHDNFCPNCGADMRGGNE